VSTTVAPAAVAAWNEMYSPRMPLPTAIPTLGSIIPPQPVGQQPGRRWRGDDEREDEDVPHGLKAHDDSPGYEQQEEDIQGEHRVARRARHRGIEGDEREFLQQGEQDSRNDNGDRETHPHIGPGNTEDVAKEQRGKVPAGTPPGG
jgi:hypothetical protein